MTSPVPARNRIPFYPDLVQRLEELKNKRPVKDGEKANVGTFFAFEYMGSSEFEWGIIPQSKRNLIARFEASEWPEPVKVKQGECVAWYVGLPENLEMAKVWFQEELVSSHTGMKESSYLREAYGLETGPFAFKTDTNGWWKLESRRQENSWGLFRTKDQARKFLKGLRGG